MSKNLGETPTQEQVIKEAIKAALCDLHTAMPGIVVSYDSSTQKAQIQPALKRKFKNGDVVDLPIITNCPVAFPRANNAFISLPVKAGDSGLLIFSERSIDKWLVSGGRVNPNDPRKFELSDGIFYPGLYPFNNPIAAHPTDLIVQNDQAKISVKPDGKFLISGPSEELLDLNSQDADLSATTTVNTVFGPVKLNKFAQFAAVKSKIDSIKG